MRFKFLTLFIMLAVSGIISIGKASAVSPNSILVNVIPANPAPNENAAISLSSYAANLDSVLITWYVNGKKVSSGIGEKSLSVNAPAAGTETTVTATLSFPDGDVQTKIIVKPTVMVLLWQANDSYVPPFYKGKAMPTPESEVKVVAMPEIKIGSGLVDPNNMIYAWKQDYNNVQDASGYGKNYFIYTNDYLDDSNNISVTTSTIDQKYSSVASLDIGTSQPKILFYKNDAKFGTIWEKALFDGHRIQGEEVLQAAPYFISPQEIRNPMLTWNWSINDGPVNIAGFSKNLIPLKAQAGVSGTSKISLQINNLYKIFETASKEINVNF